MTNGLDGTGLLKPYALSLEDRMTAGVFGHVRYMYIVLYCYKLHLADIICTSKGIILVSDIHTFHYRLQVCTDSVDVRTKLIICKYNFFQLSRLERMECCDQYCYRVGGDMVGAE